MDMLTSFEDYVMTLDSQFKNSRNQELKAAKRMERVHREEFIQLLNELKASNILHINSKWKEIFPHIKHDPRYLGMVGDSGSTPLELFWDELMIMEDEYRPARRLIFDAVKVVFV